MDDILNHWILKNPKSIMKTYWFKLDQYCSNTTQTQKMQIFLPIPQPKY
ncbi:hypothetical protein Godav_014934 [Gossypium davidsonii]|uniref:Uncharacterized protein n=2 Tax=Gossypium TaxID=3633 RepID=A0A7J8RLD1_GOSDV|nr:hypothetical protein [Gossypium davidsonii]MBA0649890.1 hypothetical protein [Gossypium klotzschianum]